MKPEDTILKDYKYAEAKYMGDRFLQALREQARVSFKAGYKQGVKACGKSLSNVGCR